MMEVTRFFDLPVCLGLKNHFPYGKRGLTENTSLYPSVVLSSLTLLGHWISLWITLFGSSQTVLYVNEYAPSHFLQAQILEFSVERRYFHLSCFWEESAPSSMMTLLLAGLTNAKPSLVCASVMEHQFSFRMTVSTRTECEERGRNSEMFSVNMSKPLAL